MTQKRKGETTEQSLRRRLRREGVRKRHAHKTIEQMSKDFNALHKDLVKQSNIARGAFDMIHQRNESIDLASKFIDLMPCTILRDLVQERMRDLMYKKRESVTDGCDMAKAPKLFSDEKSK